MIDIPAIETDEGGPATHSPADRQMSSPEIQLWRSAILMAMSDAQGENDLEKQRAKHWLMEDGRDFPFVCHMADLDPNELRSRAARLLN